MAINNSKQHQEELFGAFRWSTRDKEKAIMLLRNTEKPADLRGIGSLTLLHYAAYNGWLDVSRQLVEIHQVDPHLKDGTAGWTALDRACIRDQTDIVKYLVNHTYCDPMIKDSVGGVTPFDRSYGESRDFLQDIIDKAKKEGLSVVEYAKSVSSHHPVIDLERTAAQGTATTKLSSSIEPLADLSAQVSIDSPFINYPDYGLMIDFDPSSLSNGSPMPITADIRVYADETTIQSCTYPEESKPVSAVYSISLSDTSVPVRTLRIRHCADPNNPEELEQLAFAKTTDDSRTFEVVSGGIFESGDHYGKITPEHMCSWTIVERAKKMFERPRYIGTVLYQAVKNRSINWLMQLIVTKNDPKCIIALREYISNNCGSNVQPDDEFYFAFHESVAGSPPKMELVPSGMKLTSENVLKCENGWEIRVDSYKVSQDTADQFNTSTDVPGICKLKINTHQTVSHSFDEPPVFLLTGIDCDRKDIQISPPISVGPTPTLKAVFGLLKPRSAKWNVIGEQLMVPLNYREEVYYTSRPSEAKLELILNEWMESECSPVTWNNVMNVMDKMGFQIILNMIKEQLGVAPPDVSNESLNIDDDGDEDHTLIPPGATSSSTSLAVPKIDIHSQLRSSNYSEQTALEESAALMKDLKINQGLKSHTIKSLHLEKELLKLQHDKLAPLTRDVGLQFNYAALERDHIQNVTISQSKLFTICSADQQHSFIWDGYGFELHVPKRACPPKIECDILVDVVVGGDFMFPEGVEPVSALYIISTTCNLQKSSLLRLQHCVDLTNGRTQLCFYKAPLDEPTPPYEFKPLKKRGVFDICSRYGELQLRQFCGMAIGTIGSVQESSSDDASDTGSESSDDEAADDSSSDKVSDTKNVSSDEALNTVNKSHHDSPNTSRNESHHDTVLDHIRNKHDTVLDRDISNESHHDTILDRDIRNESHHHDAVAYTCRNESHYHTVRNTRNESDISLDTRNEPRNTVPDIRLNESCRHSPKSRPNQSNDAADSIANSTQKGFFSNTDVLFFGQMLYLKMPDDLNNWQAKFIVVKDIDALKKFIANEQFNYEKGADLSLTFTERSIKLKMNPDNEEFPGWTIKPHVEPSVILHGRATSFGHSKNTIPPACFFDVYGDTTVDRYNKKLCYPLLLEGAVVDGTVPKVNIIRTMREDNLGMGDPSQSIRMAIIKVLDTRLDSLSYAAAGSIDSLSTKLYAKSLIPEPVKDDPTKTFDSLLKCFKACIKLEQSPDNLTRKVRDFITALEEIGGGLATAADAIRNDINKELGSSSPFMTDQEKQSQASPSNERTGVYCSLL